MADESPEALGYRWWTCSASREHLKLGPVAFSWFSWGAEWWFEVIVLCRWVPVRWIKSPRPPVMCDRRGPTSYVRRD